MNKLNKKIISFVLLFSICLLVNVSYAEFTSTPVNCSYTNTTVINNIDSSILGSSSYTYSDAIDIIFSYLSNSSDNTLKASYDNMLTTLESEGINTLIYHWFSSSGKSLIKACFIPDYVDVGYINQPGDYFCFIGDNDNNSFVFTYIASDNTSIALQVDNSHSTGTCTSANSLSTVYYSSIPIKLLSGTYSSCSWDGTSYFYGEPPSPDEPDGPTLPTNAEIAQAVQAFYNSDYYKNNKDFKDFIVLLNTKTNVISIIGHNFASQLAQCIVPANYEYDGESYNQDWWRFYLRGITDQINATLFEKYYWLYSTTDLGETINYNGKGYMNELLDLRFVTQSIIIYSTTDYFVQTFKQDDEGVYWPESGTISGDQYTYDENLDPTTNEYNPLENFVPTNPSQTILGDVDFDEINKTFEENKDILNIEGASWLFTANNKLVGYFIGFLSLLIVFLIISRILGG